MKSLLQTITLVASLTATQFSARSEEWPEALSRMPLGQDIRHLGETNCVQSLLGAFQSNATVKALIFMPGATDEFHMFHRAGAILTNAAPSMMDAVAALTNQTLIRATFLPPHLLLHTDEDPLTPLSLVRHERTAQRLRESRFQSHAGFVDRDWDHLQPILKKHLGVDFRPWPHSRDSWHFYRHSFAGWNLTGWEALEAISLAGKTTFVVERNRVVFAGDRRIRQLPTIAPVRL